MCRYQLGRCREQSSKCVFSSSADLRRWMYFESVELVISSKCVLELYFEFGVSQMIVAYT
eukprot:SAG31_NODE_1333_length_8743_cov_1.681050_9_plen_60_part_00